MGSTVRGVSPSGAGLSRGIGPGKQIRGALRPNCWAICAAYVPAHLNAIDGYPATRIALPPDVLHGIGKALAMGGYLMSSWNTEHVGQHIGTGDALTPIARLVNDLHRL